MLPPPLDGGDIAVTKSLSSVGTWLLQCCRRLSTAETDDAEITIRKGKGGLQCCRRLSTAETSDGAPLGYINEDVLQCSRRL